MKRSCPRSQAAWEKTVSRTPTWTVLEPKDMTAKNGAKLVRQADQSILATGPNGSPETYTVTAHTKLTAITGIRLEALSDPSLPGKGPGRLPTATSSLANSSSSSPS